MPRNYTKEYQNYHSSPEQIKNRAARNAARAAMEKKGLVKKGDGKDVGHIKALSKGGGNGHSNLRVETVTGNRSFSRNANGSMKSETSKRGK